MSITWVVAFLGAGLVAAVVAGLRIPETRPFRWFSSFIYVSLYLGTIGALAVTGLAVLHRLNSPALIPLAWLSTASGLLLDGAVVAATLLSLRPIRPVFCSNDIWSSVFLLPRTIRAARYLAASTFLMVGTFKLISYAEFPFFQASGYSQNFYIFICILECACAAGLMLRLTTIPAALVLSLEMFGAIYTHFHNYFAKGLPQPFANSMDAFRMLIMLSYIVAGHETTRKLKIRLGRNSAIHNVANIR